ncbi:uncharacterized protein Z520_09129 [Fonsecaea multimorphosa CBS 102226]|uniref:Zn(2)-C6 fungal-type domain-containing protein n=1 Tax=Fonsecaea multimorphosa CBS 102226 TaxID=1442371 RepID=A0A0D2KEU4_9EURO|nr:uncharacterized protein Z520_09129 [Fonsecaea multimorphosa CBS 102226]KIX95213.1 hypothetical protein Z520_09129 [Fonsecaea multimorphosa CBS 102226]OAL17293.1 hypothetical protein AYO22_11859 [Fonsecaea multimorphosa]
MSSTGAPFPKRHRLRFYRSKTGCLTCRRRRKKCDESVPCNACVSRELECVWPEIQLNRDTAGILSNSPSSSPSTGPNPPRSLHNCAIADQEASELTNEDLALISRAKSNSSLNTDGLVTSNALTPPTLPGKVASWQLRTLSASPFRPEAMPPTSQLILHYYLQEGAAKLSPKPMQSNPFITQVLPRAACDETLMHAVLALGGALLDLKYDKSNPILQTAWGHYAQVLGDLRHTFQNLSTNPCRQYLRLLLILVILAHAEAISGNSQGSIFSHLRASRQLMLKFISEGRDKGTAGDKAIEGFVLELYAYLALVANITPYALDDQRTIPLDPVLLSLGFLQDYEDFGAVLSCGPSLFEKIATISVLARQRLSEDATMGQCSIESIQMYQGLLQELLCWTSPPPSSDTENYVVAHRCTGETYRYSLLVYLKSSMYGASVKDNPEILLEIQGHINIVWQFLPTVLASPFGSIILWPSMILGSCLTNPAQRNDLCSFLRAPRWHLRVTEACITMLKLLWEDPDDRAYGPFGLYLVMKKHGINFCMV